jgi:hypothetical protein
VPARRGRQNRSVLQRYGIRGALWACEIHLPELDEPDKPGKPGIRRSAFIIPAEVAKNRTKDPRPRLLVLNDAAQFIVESARGEHPRYVFTYEDHEGNRDRMYTLRSSGWVRARVRQRFGT